MAIRSLKGKKCFITGAASGIGRATAEACAAQGARLFVTDINATALDAVVQGIVADGGCVELSRALDIADYEQVQAFAADIHAQAGSMDVVMNIAGISIWGSIENLSHAQWRKTIEINLMGPIGVMECFIPPMIAAGEGGHLVNVSSAAGLFGLPWHAAYSASKFGLRGVSEVLRFDLQRHRIGVSLVCPGGVDTGLINTLEVAGPEQVRESIQSQKAHFRKLAVSPEKAAAAIIHGIKRNQYLVFTSQDIRMGHWVQRKFALPYDLFMKTLNNQLQAVVKGGRK